MPRETQQPDSQDEALWSRPEYASSGFLGTIQRFSDPDPTVCPTESDQARVRRGSAGTGRGTVGSVGRAGGSDDPGTWPCVDTRSTGNPASGRDHSVTLNLGFSVGYPVGESIGEQLRPVKP